jgi:hypothetical protein
MSYTPDEEALIATYRTQKAEQIAADQLHAERSAADQLRAQEESVALDKLYANSPSISKGEFDIISRAIARELKKLGG